MVLTIGFGSFNGFYHVMFCVFQNLIMRNLENTSEIFREIVCNLWLSLITRIQNVSYHSCCQVDWNLLELSSYNSFSLTEISICRIMWEVNVHFARILVVFEFDHWVYWEFDVIDCSIAVAIGTFCCRC